MDIKAFIRELLFSHDCVIIPGFGGFIGNFSPARIDRISGIFYPPVKQISFNRNLNHNDGLLISRISMLKGINYGEARHLIEIFVKELTGKLIKGEKVVFDHLGTFRNNSEQNVQFEPESNINYFIGAYGLEAFKCVPLKEYDVRKRITRHIDKEPLRSTSLRRNLWRAAIAIPILALLVAIPLKTDLFKNKMEATSLNPLVTAEFENNKKEVDKAVVVLPDTNISAAPKQAPENQDLVKIETPVIEEYKYCVITGSFKSEENARSHVTSLKAEGFDPEISQGPNGFFRVTAMKCNNLERAVFTRDSVIKKYPGTWISKK